MKTRKESKVMDKYTNKLKLLIREINSYLSLFKTTEILYDIGINIQSNYDDLNENNIANHLFRAMDNSLKTILEIMKLSDKDEDELIAFMQKLVKDHSDYTDDFIINEIIKKFSNG